MAIRRFVVPAVVAADGTGTFYSPYVSGFIESIQYVKTDYANGVDFTEGIRGGFIDLDGGHFSGILARAPPCQMLIRVLASEQQPRGIYRLDNIGYFGSTAHQRRVTRTRHRAAAGAHLGSRPRPVE